MRQRRADPYFDRKVYHFAAEVRGDGAVSALCYRRPRRIRLDRGQSWTIVESQVTCTRCKAQLKQQAEGAVT